MKRDELIGVFALDIMADDYEDLDRIYKGVAQLARDCKLVIQSDDALRTEVDRAVIDLVRRGLARAYQLSKSTVPLDGVPSLDQQGLYFFITDEGRKIQSTYEGWPFDESNSLLPGWSPPDE